MPGKDVAYRISDCSVLIKLQVESNLPINLKKAAKKEVQIGYWFTLFIRLGHGFGHKIIKRSRNISCLIFRITGCSKRLDKI